MSDFELMFQLFALLLGLAMAELLGGLARCWHMKAGAVRMGKTPIRLGRLTPLFGLVVLFDLTRFWVTIYAHAPAPDVRLCLAPRHDAHHRRTISPSRRLSFRTSPTSGRTTTTISSRPTARSSAG